jgi:hypothetical protein
MAFFNMDLKFTVIDGDHVRNALPVFVDIN